MTLSKSIGLLTLVSILTTLISGLVMGFQTDFHAYLFKLATFSFYASILFCGNYIVITFTNKTSLNILRIISFFNLILVCFAGLILFDIISFSETWHVVLGVSILYMLVIQLTILGWYNESHSLLHKILFLIIILTDLFLASIFFFKIDVFEMQPFILTSCIISVIIIIVSTFINTKTAKKHLTH